LRLNLRSMSSHRCSFGLFMFTMCLSLSVINPHVRRSTIRFLFVRTVCLMRSYLGDLDWPLRERDTTDQLIGSIDDVIAVVTELVDGTIEWKEACERLPKYDGVQAVE